MTANDLIAAFETLADAPDGVKRLRELVLQLAVRGKLVPQDPKEAVASALPDREVAAKKKARPAAVAPNEVDVPYVAPQGWVWTTATALGDTSPRNHVADDTIAGFVPMAVVPKEYKASLRPEARPWADIKKGFTHIADGDIAVAKITPCFQNGKACVVEGLPNGVGAGTTELLVLRPYPKTLNPLYALAFFKSPDFVKGGVETFTGTAGQQRVSNDYFRCRPFPLPPLAEQHRIVARVDELMGLLDRLEAARTARDDVRRAARDAALAALRDAEDTDAVEAAWGRIAGQMDALFAEPEDVGPLRQAVLGLAVRGRLVAQDPKDEPATNLLQKLARAREARKDALREASASGALGDALKPFDLPAGWSWCRLTDAGELARGRSRHRPRNDAVLYTGGTVPMVQTGDVARARGTVTTYTALYNEVGVEQSRLWPAGTMCITIAANIADTALLGFPACFPDSVVGFRPFPPLRDARYFHIYMRNVQSELEAFAPSTAQKNINLAILDDLILPLPPLREIEAIVAKVDALLALCDAFEARLTTARDLHAQFAAAAVHHLDV